MDVVDDRGFGRLEGLRGGRHARTTSSGPGTHRPQRPLIPPLAAHGPPEIRSPPWHGGHTRSRGSAGRCSQSSSSPLPPRSRVRGCDWILVGPGDYHERADHRHPPGASSDIPPSGVLIRTRRLHDDTAAAYGLFSSNSDGPGVWDHTYASNFDDGGYYIGACRRVCNQVIDHGWAQFNALGYSGTNSGGRLVVENSEFDHNEDGFDTNSQNNDDFPSPQDGRCPGNGTSPVTGTGSCWVFMHNYVHDNNDANVPKAGAASQGPVGTGVSIAGGRFDTVMDNRFVRNGAWGLLIVPYPDDETPPPGQHCQGGSATDLAAFGFDCTFDVWGNQVLGNTFSGNGFFGNPTNGDIGELTLESGHPINCFRGNTTPDGTSPPTIGLTNTTCGRTGTANGNIALLSEAACDSGVLPAACLPTDSYPRATKVVMHGLPTARLSSMPDPCAGVPRNPWCAAAAQRHRRARHRRRSHPVLTG